MIECQGYLAQVEFDDEANWFHGEVVWKSSRSEGKYQNLVVMRIK